MPGLVPGIPTTMARPSVYERDGRDNPGHDESKKCLRTIYANYSAGLAAAAASAAARSAAARFCTQRTDQTEPSYKAMSGTASESWLRTSGGVSTAAITKAMTMK